MDDNQSSKIIPVSIEPRMVFGLQSNIDGNIHFTAKQEVIYPVSGVLAIHDFILNKEKFLRFPEGCRFELIRISPNRKLLAVEERMDDNTTNRLPTRTEPKLIRPTRHKQQLTIRSGRVLTYLKYSRSFINIYDISTLKRRKTIYLPEDTPNHDVANMQFTYDSKGIAVLSAEPDCFLTLFFFDKVETIITGRVSNRNQKGYARTLACNPNDPGLVAVGGDFTFKLMSKTEKGFTLIANYKLENLLITSLVWLSGDVLLVGTSNTELILIEGGEPRVVHSAQGLESFDISNLVESEDAEKATAIEIDTVPDPASRLDVLNLTFFPKGFAFSIHNFVHIFERISNYGYIKKTIIHIPMTIYAKELYCINNIAINLQQDTIIVTPKHAQIFISMLFVPETIKINMLEFKTLGEPLHIDGIISLEICSWKPILMTAAKDQTVRIWNYVTGKIELVKKFQIEVSVIGLHPSGIIAAIGFTDKLRLLLILLDDLKTIKTFNFPRCTCCKFSHQGHMLATSYGYNISIISVFSFDIIQNLKGHNGLILSMCWSEDDNYLISCGEDGAVYEWQISTGIRVNEIVHKGTEYRDAVVTRDRSSIYVVTNKGSLKEIRNSDITRDFKFPNLAPLTTIALSRSDLVMFVGTESGHLYNVQVPFLEAGGGKLTNTRFFHSTITKLKISYDDQYLVTTANDGTLVVWKILNNEGRIAAVDSELLKCNDVMIPRLSLIDKNELISSLELRIEQQKAEFLYAREQGDNFHSEQMRDIHKNYCDAIKDLKDKNEEISAHHNDELNTITANIAQTKLDHEKAILDLEKEFQGKIIIEYEKSALVKKTMDDMREDYEQKLRKSAGCLQDTIEALESDFKKQLQERQDLIRQLMKELETKKIQFADYYREVEEDNDRRMAETKLKYEKILKDEQELSLKWRGEAGVLKKKLTTSTNVTLHLREEIEKLRTEHQKYQKKIYGYEKDIEDLKKEIDDRDNSIREKEKRVNELLKKNEELEKYKHVLQHKINELKSQIEPREREIKEKKDQISEMLTELEGLQQNNLKLELQLSELKDKLHGTEIALKTERIRNKSAHQQMSKICGEIHHLSGYIQNPNQLKGEVVKLYHRYADDINLQKSLSLDTEVHNEYLRQRDYLETLVAKNKTKGTNASDTGQVEKLMRENVTLITELNSIRQELRETQRHTAQMESLLGVSKKFMPATLARAKLAKAVTDVEVLEGQHKEALDDLKTVIAELTNENQSLRKQLHACRRSSIN